MILTTAHARAGAAAVALALVALTSAASPAHAATGEAALAVLDAAVRATYTAEETGIDVVQTVRFDRTTSLRGFTPQLDLSVAAGTRLRVHATVPPTTDLDAPPYYLSIRRQPSGALVGSTGREAAGAPAWATVSTLDYSGARAARAAGVPERTALTGLPAGTELYDRYLPRAPAIIAMNLILPPYADAYDEGWQDIVSTLRSDGATVIRGSVPAGVAASDGEDRCSRPLVEVTVSAAGIITASRWTQTCPGKGTSRYAATATYGPQPVQPPTKPTRAAAGIIR